MNLKIKAKRHVKYFTFRDVFVYLENSGPLLPHPHVKTVQNVSDYSSFKIVLIEACTGSVTKLKTTT